MANNQQKRQRQQQSAKSHEEDKRWTGAVRIPLSNGNPKEETAVAEVSGFESSTGTLFGRIRNEANETHNAESIQRHRWRIEDVVETIVQEIKKGRNETQQQQQVTNNTIDLQPSSQILLGLGAVWILDPASADRPQNKPSWRRILRECDINTYDTLFWIDEGMTLRIHSRPSRFPMAQNFRRGLKEQQHEKDGGIVFERTIGSMPAFAVLHKPIGLPSHSTVDNAIENLLHLYKEHRKLQYASLPQRLDTETSGLILVATHPRFASYFSKLLEQKTTTSAKFPSIQKQYRCLVSLPKDSEEIMDSLSGYIRSKSIVEHYVDANSKAPKTFVSAIPQNSGASKWQLCKLRIRDMRPTCNAWLELEIELLTGRTHQIRGQLAALGCPIVGDPLYGKNTLQRNNRSTQRMALQCCALSFVMDASIENELLAKRGKETPNCNTKYETNANESRHLEFRLETAATPKHS